MNSPRRRRFWLVPAGLLAVVAVMLTIVSFSVPLYRMFCAATGAGGTTQRASAADGALGRMITIDFSTGIAKGLPWRFRPMQSRLRVRLGQESLVFFEAENLSDTPIVGHAAFNVTPDKVGIYFKKIQCFCFTEERLGAHQKVEMPVTFFVDGRLATDPSTTDVDDITLSYTFFRSSRPKDATDLARFANAPPDAAAGRTLFAADCAGCHALDHAIEGPRLAGVYGRRAGSVPGYPYTPALAGARITWDDRSLERWLSGPRAFIPGTAMPDAIDDPVGRRDIIAYLHSLSPPGRS
ncbi:cytochrome c oxidase assembly protein [Lichenicoccus roseus]|uniref:Cytochrome c oxidase assembly protein CtaG n=1 Tax=Lichenicoccus roseus TaxID=2683649 RepID=A0A5R9J378_9PROT|nr:cytochrome c oxidase assembly protein [Lichenicoccus roseus]TLU72074.1 cytochrome c oxidase assembly protein [Lichenicoccus roseus]